VEVPRQIPAAIPGASTGTPPPRRSGARGTTVVIAQHDLLMREGILSVLSASEAMEVLAVCHDRETLLAAIAQRPPAVVVTDIRMPPTFRDEGIEVARRLRQERPEVGVVVLSAHAEPAYALTLLEDGLRGRAYLLRDQISRPAHLIGAIEEVARGASVIDPSVVEALVEERVRGHRSLLAGLTPRELQILGEIAEGKSNAAIAAVLVLTKRAVEKHVNTIFAKLALHAQDETVDRRVRAALLFLADGAEATMSDKQDSARRVRG
jgi:DNA-binding NarL/FixJ family response regulator